MCDHCPRIICLRHAPAIQAVPEDIRATLEFVCPSCHKRHAIARKDPGAPYYVSPVLVCCHVISPTCSCRFSSIQGLYHIVNGKRTEFLDKWVELDLIGARPQHARCDNRPVIVINLRLANLVEEGTPAHLIYGLFTPYYPGDRRSNLRYVDIPYCIHDQKGIKSHKAALDKSLSGLFRLDQFLSPLLLLMVFSSIPSGRLLLFIHSHTHDETGDLYFGSEMSSSDPVEVSLLLLHGHLLLTKTGTSGGES